jgi:hypothetical protein
VQKKEENMLTFSDLLKVASSKNEKGEFVVSENVADLFNTLLAWQNDKPYTGVNWRCYEDGLLVRKNRIGFNGWGNAVKTGYYDQTNRRVMIKYSMQKSPLYAQQFDPAQLWAIQTVADYVVEGRQPPKRRKRN